MPQVRGIGGFFFKSSNPEALRAWYAQHLGIKADEYGTRLPAAEEGAVWSVFSASSDYFHPSHSPFMLNYVVDDLRAALAELREAGVQVDDKVEECEYGKFGWILDPDGNRIELWEPKPAVMSESA
jgi:predicted enzyme related to lactoylglutathione lyase